MRGADLIVGAVVCTALVAAGRSLDRRRIADLGKRVGSDATRATKRSLRLSRTSRIGRWGITVPERWRTRLLSAGAGCAGALVGRLTIPVFGPFLGAAAFGALPYVRTRRSKQRAHEMMERELADLVDATALAIRSGQSISQAVDFASSEVDPPMADLLRDRLAEQRLGVPLDEALWRFADAVGTEDARLFVLVIGIQSKSGGNLAGALDEVASTIHHRLSIRRELRALSAQGRLSGVILGCLPIGFFLVLALTSRDQLEPVFRSGPGMAMISVGFAMQGAAYVWIRRLLRVEV